MKDTKLLVVDDEYIVRSYIKKVIIQEKLPVSVFSEADNGLDAVRIAKEQNPHLILMDIRIPDIDGIQAAKEILSDNREAKIVVISAYGEFEYVRAAFRVGVIDFLLKPVRPVDIAELVRKIAISEVEDTKHIDNDEKPEMIRLMEEYIKNNLDRKLYLKDMAQAIYVSPFHLSRTFKRVTGQSIVCYIHEQRFAKAEKFLLNTRLTITEIAEKVGFNDAAYFAACYKNKMGMSPTQCRKLHKNKKGGI